MSPQSSLIGFHRVLISAGILFCAGFAVWTFVVASREGAGWLWVVGGVFAVFAAGLAVYLWNLDRILGIEKDR